MTGIAPVPVPVPVAAKVPVAAPVLTTVPQTTVPQAITQLRAAAVLEATVAQQPAGAPKNQVVLQTAAGPITVKLQIPLPPAALLRLLVTMPGPNPQFRLLTVNGQLPGTGPQTAGTPPPLQGGPISPASLAVPTTLSAAGQAAMNGPPPVTVAEAGAGPPPMPQPGQPVLPQNGLTAVLLRAATPALEAGSRFTVRVVDITPPGTEPRPLPLVIPGAPEPPVAAQPGLPEPALPVPPPAGGVEPPPPPLGALPQPVAAAPPGQALPPATANLPRPPGGFPRAPGQLSPLPVEAHPEPAAPPPPIAGEPASAAASGPAITLEIPELPPSETQGAPPNPLPLLLEGTVTRNSLAGAPLINTQVGLITIGQAADLVPGARVVFVTDGPVVPPPPLPAPVVQTPAISALDQAVQVVRQADPSAAAELVAKIPQPGPELVETLAVFVAAAQSGNVREWLGGPAARILDRAGDADRKGGLIDRLSQEIGDVGVPGAAPAAPAASSPSAWQTMTVPLLVGPRIERIRITTRRKPSDEDEAAQREDEGMRFFVDLDMSRLGPIQLDGLVKRKSKRFDLILRSRFGLDQSSRRDIGEIFGRALEGMGLVGQLAFQQTAFVQPGQGQVGQGGVYARPLNA